MLINKKQFPILIFNILQISAFSIYFLLSGNYEFIIYIFILVTFLVLVLLANKTAKFSNFTLWGLSIWAFLHMAGGGIPVGDHKLYGTMIFTFHEELQILKFDQFVHAFGFGVTTFVMFELLLPLLKTPLVSKGKLFFVIIMAACGAGAFNEIVEFSATLMVENTGVGGYVNNSLDLIFNMLGAIIAAIIINKTRLGKVSLQ